MLLSRVSRVQLCATPETAAYQAPPSLGFSRQEHWSGLPFSCLRKGTPLASRVAQGVSGPSSSCVWNPRVFADDARGWQCTFVLCLHPQGCSKGACKTFGSQRVGYGSRCPGSPWRRSRGGKLAGSCSPGWLPRLSHVGGRRETLVSLAFCRGS